MFNKKYEVLQNRATCLTWDEYESKSIIEYNKLLEEKSESEMVFQEFFERNPSFLPGALNLIGQSGHYPFMHTVISQPELGVAYKRKPDFLWLSNNSLEFCPVFIEIEKPNKKMFNKNGTTTAEFNQAIEQLHEWKFLISEPANRLVFYDYFNIPQGERDKTFKPQFLLIYGRRSEYEGDKFLTGKRATQNTLDTLVVSYDRLKPISEYRQFITCKVFNQKYNVIHIPPTFKYRADCSEELVKMNEFYNQISNIKYVTEERKVLLKERYDYWIEFGKMKNKGIISGMEGE